MNTAELPKYCFGTWAIGISNSSIPNAERYCAVSKPLLDQEGYSILNQSKSDLSAAR